MSDTPIIKIQIDADEFDDFRTKFAAYQEDLSHQKEAWQGSNEAVKILSSRFEDAAGSFDRLNKAATNPKFAGESGVFTKFQKSSLETGKSWTLITKQIEKSSKGLNGLAREMLSIGKVSGGLAGAAVGGAAALYGATKKAANDLASRNAQNRQLNLAPGVAQAYGITYAKYGASEDQLSTFEQAKVDPSLRQPLAAVGVTADEIQNDDAEQLARTYLEKAGKKWNSLPEYARGNWMAGTNQGVLGMGVASFNQAASYGADDLAKSDSQFAALRDKLALKESQYNAGTDATQAFDSAKGDLGTAFDNVFIKLAPKVTDLTEKFADAVNAFSKSKELDGYIADLTDDFKKLDAAMAWVGKLADKVGPQLPSFGKGGDALDDAGLEAGHVAYDMGSLVANDQFQSNLKNFLNGHWEKISKNAVSVDGTGGNGETFTMPGKFVRDPNREADIKALEVANGMPVGYLDAHEDIESSRGKNNVNPNNPNVLGAMQFDVPTAERYGVNRYDEKSSLEGGATMLRTLYAKYHDWGMASAAYDGFAGLDKDYKKYGKDWRDHIGEFQTSGETASYLNKIEAHGVDLSGGGSGGQVSTGTVTALSKIAGFHPDNQIIDTGSTRGGNQPPILSRPAGMGNMAVPTLNVNVSAPPGSSVSVTSAGLPQ